MTPSDDIRRHPANAVFALMEDRAFRLSVIRPALEADKGGLSRLVTGKHPLRGFRTIAKAPMPMLLPVISDEANLSADLAQGILTHWFRTQVELRTKVSERLAAIGCEPVPMPFDEDGLVGWNTLPPAEAAKQFDGTFLEGEDKNAVMLMSLLLGWFGGEEDETADAGTPAEEDVPVVE
jgi:hypothetical protein